MQERGLRVDQRRGRFRGAAGRSPATSRRSARPTSSSSASRRTPDRAGAAAARRCFGPDTVVVSTQNGIPWWYFQDYGGELDGLRLERVDPGGVIAARDRAAARRRLARLLRHRHRRARRHPPHRGQSHQLRRAGRQQDRSARKRIAEALIARRLPLPGHDAVPPRDLGEAARQRRVQPDQRADRRHARGAGAPSRGVAPGARADDARPKRWRGKLGIELPISIDQRMAGAEKVGAHKTSMLQDLEAGRPMELEAVVGAVVELGERLGCRCRRPAPSTRARSCWTSIALTGASAVASGVTVRRGRVAVRHQQSLVPARRVADRDDHDREPAVCLDAVRPAAAGRHRLEALGHPVRVHAVHPVPDLGAAARRLADRSARAARVHQRRRRCSAASAGPGMGYATSLPMLYALYCLAGIGAAFVYSGSIGSALKWFKERRGLASGIMAAGFGGGTALFIPFISSMIASQRLPVGVRRDRHVAGRRDPHRRPVPAASAGGAGRRCATRRPRRAQARASASSRRCEMLRTPQFYVMYVMFVLMATGGLLVTANAGPMAQSWGLTRCAALTLAATLSPLANGAQPRLLGLGVRSPRPRERRWSSRSCCRRSACSWCVARRPALGAAGSRSRWCSSTSRGARSTRSSRRPPATTSARDTPPRTTPCCTPRRAWRRSSAAGSGALLFEQSGSWAVGFYGSAVMALIAAGMAVGLRASNATAKAKAETRWRGWRPIVIVSAPTRQRMDRESTIIPTGHGVAETQSILVLSGTLCLCGPA